ncbi:ATPase [Candidatus Bathyarchaeota archaeon]|nr:ATPase [Candidatus Bathyarchaeota archaeon]
MKLVLDTSIIIQRNTRQLLGEDVDEIIIPYAVLSELEAQANEGREEGYRGLEEIKDLRLECLKKHVELSFKGDRPSYEEIQLASKGRIDALIRDVVRESKAILVTMDYVQSLVAEAQGLNVDYMELQHHETRLSFKQYFSNDTMSVHLKEDVPPHAKRGEPGDFHLEKIRQTPRTKGELRKMIEEIKDATDQGKAFVEVSQPGAMVVQLDEYRIAIAEPPFSDGLEITVVRPLVKLTLDDYYLSSQLQQRLAEKAEGILIAGPPGSGKTTFASSLAEYYTGLGKITKTMESPRDLQVGPEITQYGAIDGKFHKTANILLLVRPDYTIFDEVRQTEDFEVFMDMRLAGVGMVGVVHASEALDALQRFLHRTELGMIPSIIDTIIFIKDGEVRRVYTVGMTVKVPSGMIGEDLARPVVEIKDFETGYLEYDIFTFGNESVVVPVAGTGYQEYDNIQELAKERIMHHVRRFDKGAEIEITGPSSAIIRVHSGVIPKIIGKNGRNISRLEKQLGLSLDVQEL